MKKHMVAAFVAGAAGLMVSVAMSLPGGEPPAANIYDMSVSAMVVGAGSLSIDLTISTTNPTVGGLPVYPVLPANSFAVTYQTVSCNPGNYTIPFRGNGTGSGQSLNWAHAYIGTSFYRINNEGRLEQLAVSWLKHAFTSASQAQTAIAGPNGQPACGLGTGCSISGDMGTNCSDTYGSGLNASIARLGPRFEVIANDPYATPTTGAPSGGPPGATPPTGRTYVGWNPVGSFFDNYTQTTQVISGTNYSVDLPATTGLNNGTVNYTAGTSTHAKRNVVLNSEIGPGALYNNAAVPTDPSNSNLIMEAYYVQNGDQYKFNNVAHRRFKLSATAVPPYSANSFVLSGMHTFGPASMTWGDQGFQATPVTVTMPDTTIQRIGEAYISSRVVSLGAGQYRYEYAVFNMDIDRMLTSFEVPTPAAAVISSQGFWQPREWTLDKYDNAPWVGGYDNTKGAFVFAPPAPPAGKIVNGVRWGEMYTFWFTTNMPPRANGRATMALGPSRTIAGFVNTDAQIAAVNSTISVPRQAIDIASIGQLRPPYIGDGLVTVEDLDGMIFAFFNQTRITIGGQATGPFYADIASIGQLTPPFTPDNNLTVEDLDAIFSMFFVP